MNKNAIQFRTMLCTVLFFGATALFADGQLLVPGAVEGAEDAKGVLYSVVPDDDGFQWIEADGKRVAEGVSMLPVPGTAHCVYLSPGLFPDVMLRDGVTGKETQLLGDHPIDSGLFVLADGRIVWVDESGNTVAYDAKKGAAVEAFPALPKNCIALSPDGTAAAVATEENGVRSFDLLTVADGKHVAKLPFPARQGTIPVGGRHSPSFSPDGKFLVLIRAGIQPQADVELYEIATGKLTSLTSDHAEYRLPRFSADGKSVLAGSVNGLVQLNR